MPLLQAISERANYLFSRENIGTIAWPGGQRLAEIAEKLGVATNDAEMQYLGAWPMSLQRCIIGVLETATEGTERIPVTMCWAPDYDYSVQVWDAHATANSARAITMVLRGPYPDGSAKGA